MQHERGCVSVGVKDSERLTKKGFEQSDAELNGAQMNRIKDPEGKI